MKNKDEFLMICEISKRSEEMGIGFGDRFTRNMDIEIAHKKFNLQLDEFLKADDVNFSHDFITIQANIDRQDMTWKDEFAVPRFASN